jgi:hypothetical protein
MGRPTHTGGEPSAQTAIDKLRAGVFYICNLRYSQQLRLPQREAKMGSRLSGWQFPDVVCQVWQPLVRTNWVIFA